MFTCKKTARAKLTEIYNAFTNFELNSMECSSEAKYF